MCAHVSWECTYPPEVSPSSCSKLTPKPCSVPEFAQAVRYGVPRTPAGSRPGWPGRGTPSTGKPRSRAARGAGLVEVLRVVPRARGRWADRLPAIEARARSSANAAVWRCNRRGPRPRAARRPRRGITPPVGIVPRGRGVKVWPRPGAIARAGLVEGRGPRLGPARRPGLTSRRRRGREPCRR